MICHADYQTKIQFFDGTHNSIIAQQHVDKMADFYELHEIYLENVAMRLFVQTFVGEVRNWFIGFPTTHIVIGNSVYAELLIPLRVVETLETNKVNLFLYSFMTK